MSNNFEAAEITSQILETLGNKLEKDFGAKVEPDTVLRLAKDLGFVKGRQGRNGGTFAQEAGYAFLGSQSTPEAEDEEFLSETNDDDDSIPF